MTVLQKRLLVKLPSPRFPIANITTYMMSIYSRRHDPIGLRDRNSGSHRGGDHYSPSASSSNFYRHRVTDRASAIYNSARSKTGSVTSPSYDEGYFEAHYNESIVSSARGAPHPAPGPIRRLKYDRSRPPRSSTSSFQGLPELKSSPMSKKLCSLGMIIRAAHHEPE